MRTAGELADEDRYFCQGDGAKDLGSGEVRRTAGGRAFSPRRAQPLLGSGYARGWRAGIERPAEFSRMSTRPVRLLRRDRRRSGKRRDLFAAICGRGLLALELLASLR